MKNPFAMDTEQLAGLKKTDFRKLLKVPEKEIVGEVIRLNCTIYANSLDVIRVCNIIRMKRK